MIGNIIEKQYNGYAGLTGITRKISVENLFNEIKETPSKSEGVSPLKIENSFKKCEVNKMNENENLKELIEQMRLEKRNQLEVIESNEQSAESTHTYDGKTINGYPNFSEEEKVEYSTPKITPTIIGETILELTYTQAKDLAKGLEYWANQKSEFGEHIANTVFIELKKNAFKTLHNENDIIKIPLPTEKAKAMKTFYTNMALRHNKITNNNWFKELAQKENKYADWFDIAINGNTKQTRLNGDFA